MMCENCGGQTQGARDRQLNKACRCNRSDSLETKVGLKFKDLIDEKGGGYFDFSAQNPRLESQTNNEDRTWGTIISQA